MHDTLINRSFSKIAYKCLFNKQKLSTVQNFSGAIGKPNVSLERFDGLESILSEELAIHVGERLSRSEDLS